MKKKAAVSGSHGFIGQALSDYLVANDFEVTPVPRDLFFKHTELKGFFEQLQPDYIFHLAAYGNHSKDNLASEAVKGNVLVTFNLLVASSNVNYKAFVNFGSSSEYGKKHKAMAEDNLLEPETFYAATKAGATHLADAFRKIHNKPVLTIRPFSVYGPGEADFRFIPTVIRCMETNQPFKLDEKANHDWIYIDDFVRGVLHLAENIKETDGIINLGSGKMHSNKEICELLKWISGKEYKSVPIEGMRSHDSPIWRANIQKLKELDFYCLNDIEEGLSKTYKYYRDRYNQPTSLLSPNTQGTIVYSSTTVFVDHSPGREVIL